MIEHSCCDKCERTLPQKLPILGKGYQHRPPRNQNYDNHVN